jgi:hypothetical protein
VNLDERPGSPTQVLAGLMENVVLSYVQIPRLIDQVLNLRFEEVFGTERRREICEKFNIRVSALILRFIQHTRQSPLFRC